MKLLPARTSSKREKEGDQSLFEVNANDEIPPATDTGIFAN